MPEVNLMFSNKQYKQEEDLTLHHEANEEQIINLQQQQPFSFACNPASSYSNNNL